MVYVIGPSVLGGIAATAIAGAQEQAAGDLIDEFRQQIKGRAAEFDVQTTSVVRRGDPANPAFNPSLRQLVHVGFKIAAQMGDRYLAMLRTCEPAVAKNVTGNLFDRHLKPLFI